MDNDAKHEGQNPIIQLARYAVLGKKKQEGCLANIVSHLTMKRISIKRIIVSTVAAMIYFITLAYAAAADIRWEAPSSVNVGQTFYVRAYYNSSLVNSVYVDGSASSGSVWEWDAANQYKAATAGNVTFYFQYDVGSQRYTSTKVVTIKGSTQPTTSTLGSVSLSLSSTSVVPGDAVSCSLSAYSTTGASITSSSNSWKISSPTNDTISSSGIVTVAPVQIPRDISVTGSCTYNGVTKSATKTITVVPTITSVVDPTITNVMAQQRYPWNGKVDISYTVMGELDASAVLIVSATDLATGSNYVASASALYGDTGLDAAVHRLVWDMSADGCSFSSTDVVFKVSCEAPLYCVIDLSEGQNARSYPVTYLMDPPDGGFNVDEYKTSKLVLRRIESGSFIMGEDQTIEAHRVTLTKSFYVGIFPITQKQYALVMGANPSQFSGETLPVERVSYNEIRGTNLGANWPGSSTVDSSSFIGKLRERTGLEFDLPTEAQWEYACRAGTTTTYYWGDTIDGNYTWYVDNSENATHVVGSKTANDWGLYDMVGNVWDWCLDWYSDLQYGTDPKGSSSKKQYRVARGGAWNEAARSSCSSARGQGTPSCEDPNGGFRIARTMSVVDAAGVFCSGMSEASAVDLSFGARNALSVEHVHYSTDWVGGADSNAVAVLAVNDETLHLAVGSGFVDWTPLFNGTYVLTHKVMSDGEQIGETLSATFTVTGKRPQKPFFSPEGGTVFLSGLSVSILCLEEGATIHYTTDGCDPTTDSPVYRRFRIGGKTLVKAIAVKDGLVSDVVEAEYALGRCNDPVITPMEGVVFAHSNNIVTMQWDGDSNVGVLRYTIDGSDPTAVSPVYEGPIVINDSTVIKAKVFSDTYFDSNITTASLVRVWENVATPVIDAEESFTGSKTKVVISCATVDAIVRYTLNGNEPNSHSTKYTGPFYVTDSCTVKAYAVKTDYLNSAVATHAIEKVWGIGDSLGKPDHGFATEGDGDAGWTRVADATAPNGEAMKSGSITHNQTSTLSTTVMGPGTLTFSWMTSCEEDPDGRYEWDHAEFAVDGNVLLRRDGVNSWKQESVRIEGGGEHTVTWVYKKDDVDSEGDDATWVAGYGWVSDLTETQTTDVHVPYAWLLGHDPEIVDEYDAYEAAARVTGANGHKVWESYVIGSDPNDRDDSLKITSFPMKANGTPDFEAITISPPQSKWNVEGAQPVLRGRATLEGTDEWQAVTDKNKADMRFFKVEVVLP